MYKIKETTDKNDARMQCKQFLDYKIQFYIFIIIIKIDSYCFKNKTHYAVKIK